MDVPAAKKREDEIKTVHLIFMNHLGEYILSDIKTVHLIFMNHLGE